MFRKSIAAIFLILAMLSAAACVTVAVNPTGLEPIDQTNTAAAKTVSALETDIVSGRDPSLPTLTPHVTVTPTLTSTPKYTPTPTLTGTPSALCVNRATFVDDVNYKDGAKILANSTFTKSWELKNSGTCTWNSSYSVIFAKRGTDMNGPDSTPILTDGEVRPGDNVKVSVTLRAPSDPGEYEGYWMLRSDDNRLFGTGQSAAAPFFVKIQVTDEFSFAEDPCRAEWSSSAGPLPCPGQEGDSRGFIQIVQDPTMEDNQQEEGPGLVLMPKPEANGYIVGKFPAMVVPTRTDFRAVMSCYPGEDGCYVHFKVTYRVDGGPEQLLGEWNEGYEGGVTDAVKDLNMVSGRSTEFYFYVYVYGPPDKSKAVLFFPRIIKN